MYLDRIPLLWGLFVTDVKLDLTVVYLDSILLLWGLFISEESNCTSMIK